jgi:phosphatidylglycerol:prolipoprotein diacylglycerol transferase
MNDFWHWWQHIPQHLDPVIFDIGGFKLQYYGLMYVVAFVVTYLLVTHRLKHEERFQLTPDQVQALITFMMLGVIVGGRLGYVLFYNLPYYLKHPLEIILPFDLSNGFTFTGITGMSFHGGLICVILFTWLYCRKNGLSLLEVADLFIPPFRWDTPSAESEISSMVSFTAGSRPLLSACCFLWRPAAS